MVINNYKIRHYDTASKEWSIKKFTKAEYHVFLDAHYRLPGKFELDARTKFFIEARTHFNNFSTYTNYPENTKAYNDYWLEEGFRCMHGVSVDEYFITGVHYFYTNYLQINDKIKGRSDFPDFWDSDIWFFYCFDIAQLQNKDLAIVKKRQFGSSLKIMAYIANIAYFFESKVCKIFSTDIAHVKDSWSFLDDYKNFLNENTGWDRQFNPETMLYWKQQQKIVQKGVNGNKTIDKGRKNIIRGLTTKTKPSAIVGGKLDFCFAEEAGKNATLDLTNNFLQKAMRAGDIKTGFFVAAGSVGDLKECEPLKKFILNPDDNGFLSFPNVWSDRPEERIGMFVPEYYSYGSCIDEFGNSLIEQANEKIDNWLEEIKNKSTNDYLTEISQAPRTIEDVFRIRQQNIFPTALLQKQYEYLDREFEPIHVTLNEKDGVVHHTIGADAPTVIDFPVKKSTDRRGCVCVVDFPIENAPIGVYYGGCDPVTQTKTVTSESLQCLYIYRSDYYSNDVLIPGKIVAWYTGRYDNVEVTYEICRKLMKFYNCRTMIEADVGGFIRHLIYKNEKTLIMRRSEYPKLTEFLPHSKIFDDYGYKKGSSKAGENHHLESIMTYLTTEIGIDYDKDGNDRIRYGVERIMDKMLVKELLMYGSGNFDRLWAFAYAIDVAEGNTIRNNIKKVNTGKKELPPIRTRLNPYRGYNYNNSAGRI